MKRKKFVNICLLIASICYILVSYGAFYDSDISKGILYFTLATAMLVLAIKSFKDKGVK